jgi:hypothetical protein
MKFFPVSYRHLKLKAYVLRIMAQEIYTWKGAVAPDLIKVLGKCDVRHWVTLLVCEILGIIFLNFIRVLCDLDREREMQGHL